MKTFQQHLKHLAADYLRPEVGAWVASSGFAIAAAVTTALLLAGCTSGIAPSGQLIDGHALQTQKTFSDVTTTMVWPKAEWWTVYGDSTLDQLVAQALAGSPDLKAAQARLARANALAGAAEGQAGPQVTGQGSAIREKFTTNYIYPPPLGGSTYTTTDLGLNFSWDLDFWGRNSSAIAAAKNSAKAAEADHAAAQLALTTSVTRTWFQLQRLYLLHDVLQAEIRQRQDILNLTNQRVTAGLDTNVELRQAEAALPQARLDLIQIEESMSLTRNQLAALLGQGPDAAASLPRPAAKASVALMLPANLPADLISRRPDIAAARWRVEAAARDIDNAKAQFYPNINLIAALSVISLKDSAVFNSGSLDESAGPALTLPIYQPALRDNLRSKDADYDSAVAAYNSTVVDSVKDVADQIVAMRSILSQQGEEALALNKTEAAYALARQRYEAGLGNYLTVLTAETAVLQQRRADAELKARVLDANVQLVRALGGGYVASPELAQATTSTNTGVTQ